MRRTSSCPHRYHTVVKQKIGSAKPTDQSRMVSPLVQVNKIDGIVTTAKKSIMNNRAPVDRCLSGILSCSGLANGIPQGLQQENEFGILTAASISTI
ncbi:hypothetical protein [Planctomicrobium piriforme]|uniref:hypothetical protein n=1 Tax=Planctomicrobium piriforme TaxID=1576369 RepID=UPI001113B3DB|nr:hypothetical protein [Planctomicrobium piriforme]